MVLEKIYLIQRDYTFLFPIDRYLFLWKGELRRFKAIKLIINILCLNIFLKLGYYR